MSKRVPVSRNPDRTRRKLLNAAIRLFSAKGFSGVSVDQIVSAARVNKRMVYHYFGSKEAIYGEALREVYTRLETVELHAIEKAHDPRQQLASLLDSYFRFLMENEQFVQMLQWENLDHGRHIARIEHRLNKNPFFVRFHEIIDRGVQAGHFRSDLNIAHLLIHFIGLCFIYHSNRYSLSQSLNLDLSSPKVLAEGSRQALALVFQGIGTKK